MLKVDYFFNYKFLLRFLLIHKSVFLFNNSFGLSFLHTLLVYFSINELESFDDTRTINYFYLFRFFFGCRCYIVGFSTVSSYNKVIYNFNVQIFLKNRNCFFSVFFLVNDILSSYISFSFFKFFYMSLKKGDIYFFVRFFDMNFFLERKTNPGLYDLIDNLNFRFFFKCSDLELCYIVLTLLKVF